MISSFAACPTRSPGQVNPREYVFLESTVHFGEFNGEVGIKSNMCLDGSFSVGSVYSESIDIVGGQVLYSFAGPSCLTNEHQVTLDHYTSHYTAMICLVLEA